MWVPMGDHCLFGVIQHHQLPPPEQLQLLLDEAWGMSGKFRITHCLGKKFMFHFDSKEERDLVLEDTPWAVNGMFLMLKSVENENVFDLERLNMDTTPIWMQINGLPIYYPSSVAAETFGPMAGEVIKVDTCSQLTRVQVKINPKSPLIAGFFVELGDSDGTKWCYFSYERVFELCFLCGRIGHSREKCDVTLETAQSMVDAAIAEGSRRLGYNVASDGTVDEGGNYSFMSVPGKPLYRGEVMVHGPQAACGSKSNKMVIYDAEEEMPLIEPEFFNRSDRLGEPPLTIYVMRRIVKGKVKLKGLIMRRSEKREKFRPILYPGFARVF